MRIKCVEHAYMMRIRIIYELYTHYIIYALYTHVIRMLYTCYTNYIHMLYPFDTHVIRIIYAFYMHFIRMLYEFYSKVLYINQKNFLFTFLIKSFIKMILDSVSNKL